MNKKIRFSLFAGLLFISIISNFVFALDKISIDINNSYNPGDEIKFKIFIYNENLEKVDGRVSYKILDYYSDVMASGVVNSGEEINYTIPVDASMLWGIIANYGTIQNEAYFNIGDLQKLDIAIEGDTLILTNIGNIPYDKSIYISIGDKTETALVYLAVNDVKRIHLTAPVGNYNIRVTDGTKENEKTFEDVGLTGNVIGLEKIANGNLMDQYPLVSLFLGSILLIVVVIGLLKLQKRFFG